MDKTEKDRKEGSQITKIIPGPRGWPLIGNIRQLDTRNLQMSLYNWKLEYGPVFQFAMMRQRVAVLSNADVFKEVLSHDNLQHRPEHSFYNMFNFEGKGTTLSNFGEKDVVMKEISRKVLHESIADEHLKKLHAAEMERLIDQLCTGKDIDLGQVLLSSILRQVTIHMLGSDPTEAQLAAVTEHYHAVIEIFAEGREFLLTMLPWVRYIPGSTRNAFLNITKAKEDVMRELISAAKKTYVEGQEHGIFHRFMTKQKRRNEEAGCCVLDDEHMCALMIDIIGGGPAGTSRNLIVCFLELLNHPDIYDKAKSEMEIVCQGKKMEDLRQEDCTYLQAFVMECMRIASIIHITLPHAVEEDISVAGYKFEKGMLILGSVWNVHHDEETWGDPFVLRPERFLDDKGKLHAESHPTRKAFVPFGAGARYCKGKDWAMSTIFRSLLHILFHCELQPPTDLRKLPENDPRKYRSVVGLQLPTFSCRFSRKK